MNILILGGSGFVGTRLVELLLAAGHNVTIGDIVKSVKYPELWKYCDVCKPEDLRRILPGTDTIVNLAAAHRDDVRPVSLYEQVNVDGARKVCQSATEQKIRSIVFTSSVAIYGFPEWDYQEGDPKKPFNEYGRTKLLAEEVYRKWLTESRENALHIIRPTVIFGEGNRGNIYNLFHQIATGRFLMVGNGQNKKSIAYVGNIAAFLKWDLEHNQEQYSVYNYIDKPDWNMKELVAQFENVMRKKLVPPISLPFWLGLAGGACFDMLASIIRRQLPISSIRIRKFCAQTVFNSDKMRSTGFIPPFSLEEALKKTIEFEFLQTGKKEDSTKEA